jgi:exosome complex RNA-binding protein Rrp42 (RNase PH superfamily)
VICTLATEITAPRKSSRPGAGSISFAMEILPMAHPSTIDSNSLDAEIEQCLVMLESLFRDTYCIDFETLCIEANKSPFSF